MVEKDASKDGTPGKMPDAEQRMRSLAHYSWVGDTLNEDITVDLVNECNDVIERLMVNHFDMDLSDVREWLAERCQPKTFENIVLKLPDGREFYVKDIREFEAVRMAIYDRCTRVEGATLEIWENTATGEMSFGWYGGTIVEGDADEGEWL